MKNYLLLIAVLFFSSGVFANSGNNIDLNSFESEETQLIINTVEEDICSITINIYENGVLVASGTGVSLTGDCREASALAWLAALKNYK